jgi:O-methyltransferase domain/Dimerisation domain
MYFLARYNGLKTGEATAMNEPRMDQILQTGLGFWASKTLLSAVEIELFTELAKGPGTLTELRDRLRLHSRSAHDFLDALVALKFLERRDGTYYNTPSTDLYLDKRKPSYIGGMFEMANNRLYQFWGGLTAALRTGEPQSEIMTGEQGFFELLSTDAEKLGGYLQAMTGLSRGSNIAISQRFPWSEFKTAVDVGTAQGDLITQVALANPHIAGIGFDLPQVRPVFEDYITGNGLSGRVHFHPGSFFDSPIPNADVVMMGHILHDWNLEEKKMLIRKAYEALPTGGALIVYESIIDDDRSKNVFGLLMSLNMLIEHPGGFDYTGADCIGWMQEAGFTSTQVEHLVGPDSMVVGIK